MRNPFLNRARQVPLNRDIYRENQRLARLQAERAARSREHPEPKPAETPEKP